jgi:hypothetical protein
MEAKMSHDDGQPVRPVTVHVNAQPVHLEGHRQSGLAIKEAAVAQGVAIKLDYVLYEEVSGERTRPVRDEDVLEVSDETRFLADEEVLTIHVNHRPVRVDGAHQSGLAIKQAAIQQGMKIQLDFILLEELGDGHTRRVKDDQTIEVSHHSRFDAIPDDDHS